MQSPQIKNSIIEAITLTGGVATKPTARYRSSGQKNRPGRPSAPSSRITTTAGQGRKTRKMPKDRPEIRTPKIEIPPVLRRIQKTQEKTGKKQTETANPWYGFLQNLSQGLALTDHAVSDTLHRF